MNIGLNTDNLIDKKFLTPKDLGMFFNISRATVYRMIEKRTIPFYKINGGIRFLKNDIEEYLNQTRIGSIKM